ncbi:unnamed protein product [Dovyalis caffra]|uniref:Ricin B lectin domain-containing protein n=1 Tax=Dovyalis caffra TaxID=77055 RepID=A0AAV1RUK5_9ROSI|nr:unnamed protein product [Dovyalis caffra]
MEGNTKQWILLAAATWFWSTVMGTATWNMQPLESGATALTVETNADALPLPMRIGWLNDTCLQANINIPWVEKCSTNRTEQKWALYADGSIRPQKNQDMCLTSNSGNAERSIILIQTCSPALSNQVWGIRDDGILYLSPYNGLVMSVFYADPVYRQLILWKYNPKSVYQK